MAIQLLINDVDLSGYLRYESITISADLGRRGALKFTLEDTTIAIRVLAGQEVEVLSDSVQIFKGTVEKIKETVPLGGGVNTITVDAVDFSQLADRFFVANYYEDELVGDIVKAIVSTDTLLSGEGVTTAGVDDGFTVDKITFDHVKVSSALTKLAELGGWVWYIDSSKDLKFYDRSSYTAPNNFGDGDQRYMSAKYSRDRGSYYNRLVLKGGHGKTDGLDPESFKGDGETIAFLLRYEAARPEDQPGPASTPGSHPIIKLDTVESTRVGIQGVDDQDAQTSPGTYDFDWFWGPGEKEISQNPNNDALTSGETLEVTYIGTFEARIEADNKVEQDARAVIEGGSGIYEAIVDEDTIDGFDNLAARAESLLAINDQIDGTVEIKTALSLAYSPGQLMELTFADHAITGQWLIDRVKIRFSSSGQIFQTLTLIDSEKVSSAVDFWRQLEEQGRAFSINERQSIHVLKKSYETITISDITATAVDGDSLIDDDLDEYTFFRIGDSRIGGAHFATPAP